MKRTKIQILLGFFIVMSVVLLVAGGLSYRWTSELVIRNTKSHLAETATQASARIDAVLAQLDSISMLLVMNTNVQQLMYLSKQGAVIPVEKRLSLRPIVDDAASLSWLIAGIDLYTETEPLYPLENNPLVDLIGPDGLDSVRRNSGRLVWFGAHPDNPSLLLAVRQVKLEQHDLAGGGYIVIKASNSLGDVINSEFSSIKGSNMHLFDRNGKLIATTAPDLPGIERLGASKERGYNGYNQITIENKTYLHIMKQSDQVNWSIHMLVPLSGVTEELAVVKHLFVIALIAGAVVCIILTWFLSDRITLPMLKLRRIMRNVHFALPQPNEERYFNLDINDLNQAYNKLVRDLQQLVETVYEKERLKNKAEIKMLQAQIHPHFLFNTLDSLRWTLAEKDLESAQLVYTLSKLFRYSIKTSEGDDWVTLMEEIEHCRRYLEVMKYRLAHRLCWDIRMPESLGVFEVPKLLIQPLVENAIQHGIERKIDPGKVSIRVEIITLEDRVPTLLVNVRDDGVGMGKSKLEQLQRRLSNGEMASTESGTGIGLLNVARRMKIHFGTKYGLQLTSIPDHGTDVRLTFPYRGRYDDETNDHSDSR